MLGEHGEEFDERNPFLHLALGLVSASRRLDAVLARYGRRASSSPDVPRLPEDELLLDFLLGLVSFRENVHHVLRAAKRASRAAPGPGPGSRPTLRGILR
ncbi:hypothetical protein [Sorangium sp. So ce1078]|uniref:hypothetical protein n=1 Tax=Sorangium sp. So ce1078 TaxID=3133329 RepID=UPI003F5EFF04